MFRNALFAFALTLPASVAMAQSDSTESNPSASDTTQMEEAQTDVAQTEEMSPLTAAMLEDADVVSLEGNYDVQMWENADPLSTMIADLTRIGGVEDVMIDTQGTILGLTTDVGGFLGIGESTVMIPLEDLRLIRSNAESDDVTVITRLSHEQLEDLEPMDD